MPKKITLFFVLVIAACGQLNNKQKGSSAIIPFHKNWKTLADTNFSVQYPSTWQLEQSENSVPIDTSENPMPIFSLYALEDTSKYKGTANIDFVIHILQGKDVRLSDFMTAAVEDFKKTRANCNIIENNVINNGDDTFSKVIFSYSDSSNNFECEQRCRIVSGKLYILTFSDFQNEFDDFKQQGEEILNTFKLKK